MARLVGVDLPREKRMEIALTYIFGVGRTRANATLAATGIDPGKRAKDLTDDEVVQLRDYIEANFKVEGDLRREVPVRGQRTRTNARTRKGPKKVVANKKKPGKK
jgi:small subunit ribosomal protein S13